MEISKGLQKEIVAVQRKLQCAIMEHQTYKNRLETEPNNPDILGQMKRIQVYISSLGRSQRQVVQRLRTEVEAFTTDNANGSKVSIAALLGLNNNHITNNNETKHETAANGFETKPSKENYEEIVRNGDVHHSPAQDNDCAKLPSPSSVETISGEDDVVAVSMDENSDEKQEEEKQKEHKTESMEKEDFLDCLGLITQARCTELQNRRVERKRRSTANPHFIYPTYNQQPSKRRRLYSYFQSENAPHTRQTTARMNGPSPPPNKTQPAKSTSPPAQTVTKSLIPVQKSTTRPNILRNADSKVFVNKNKIEDNQIRSSVPSAKFVQPISNKTVHIPGLPSSLTIERIGNEPVVCICCRNPDSLTICKNCSSNYHVSCHTRSLVPSRTCPRCVLAMDEEEGVGKDDDAEIKREAEAENKLPHYKKNEKLAATTHASGAIGKARENAEVYKTVGGLHKVDAAQKKRILSTAFGVNHLPASTFLIPITSNNTSTSNVEQSEGSKFIDIEQRQNIASHNPYIDQHSRSNITYIQAEEQVPHPYQLSGTTIQPEKHQSYLIIKKITESAGRSDQPLSGETEDQNRSAVFNYQLPTSGSTTLQTGFHPLPNSLFYDRNIRKKQNNRAASLHCVTVPKLSNSLNSVSNDYQLDRATLNGRKPWAKLSGGKLCINQSTRSVAETLLPFYGDSENSGNEPESVGPAEEAAATNLDGRSKHGSRVGTFIHSLFPGHNKSYTITGRSRELRGFGPNDRDCPLLRQQLCRAEHELESREQSDSKPATVQLQRRALTRFFEHVKLEEAHIPAPLGTKLAHKDEVGDDEIIREDAPVQRYDDDDAVAETPLLTSCDELDEDRLVVRFPWVERDTVSENSHDDNAADRLPVRSISDITLIKPSDDLPDQVELTCVNAQSSCTMAFRQSIENDHPAASVLSINTYHARQQQDNETTAAAMRIAQSNLSDLHNEVSVPDDKADTERQDLPSGRRSRSRSGSSSSSSSGHSDTPEQAMNANNFSDDFEILAIGIVSPQEKREELRQHESATANETDRNDTATG
ncbi:PHD finger protein 21A [Formica fusca]